MSTRWQGTNAPRGDDYDARWRRLAAGGQNIHGEADLVRHYFVSQAEPAYLMQAVERDGWLSSSRRAASR